MFEIWAGCYFILYPRIQPFSHYFDSIYILYSSTTLFSNPFTMLTVLAISPDSSIKLVSVPTPIMAEHISLDGLTDVRLGMFITFDGKPNPLAKNIVRNMVTPFGFIDAAEGACGMAYLYDDEGPMTSRMWKRIQIFVKEKKSRGLQENARLEQIESDVMRQRMKEMMNLTAQ